VEGAASKVCRSSNGLSDGGLDHSWVCGQRCRFQTWCGSREKKMVRLECRGSQRRFW